MAMKGDHDKDIGLGEAPTNPTHEGPYTVALDPETHKDEYAADGSTLRSKHGIQHSFPAGERYGGSAGSGPKKPGSEGDGLHGKSTGRTK